MESSTGTQAPDQHSPNVIRMKYDGVVRHLNLEKTDDVYPSQYSVDQYLADIEKDLLTEIAFRQDMSDMGVHLSPGHVLPRDGYPWIPSPEDLAGPVDVIDSVRYSESPGPTKPNPKFGWHGCIQKSPSN